MDHDTLLRAMLSTDVDDESMLAPNISLDGKIELLNELAERYQRFMHDGCPFAPGDLITPRKDSGLRCSGEPYVVLETNSGAEAHFTDDPGSGAYGRRPDIRIAYRDRDGEMMTHWSESWRFEPFKP